MVGDGPGDVPAIDEGNGLCIPIGILTTLIYALDQILELEWRLAEKAMVGFAEAEDPFPQHTRGEV